MRSPGELVKRFELGVGPFSRYCIGNIGEYIICAFWIIAAAIVLARTGEVSAVVIGLFVIAASVMSAGSIVLCVGHYRSRRRAQSMNYTVGIGDRFVTLSTTEISLTICSGDVKSVSLLANRVSDIVGLAIDLEETFWRKDGVDDRWRTGASAAREKYGSDWVVTVGLLRNLQELNELITDVTSALAQPARSLRRMKLPGTPTLETLQRSPRWWRAGNWSMAVLFGAVLALEVLRWPVHPSVAM